MNEQNKENISSKQSVLTTNTKKAVNKKLEIISQIPLFQKLPLNAFNLLLLKLKEKSYRKNEFVIKQNDIIDNVYLILQGKFMLSINHKVQFDIQHDINTFINYNNELILFTYNKKNFFGDIEMFANYKKSLFSIKALEEDCVLGVVDRKSFWEIIYKEKDEFRDDVENKLDMLQERITDILNQKIYSSIDKLKLNKEKISYQLEVNQNYKLITEKFDEIKNNILNNKNKIIFNDKSKSLDSKSLDLNKTSNSSLSDNKTDKNIFNKNMKNVIQKSSSAEDIFNYEKKILNLFKFPTVLKYLNKFKNISKLEPQKEFEFLYHVKNHLQEQLRTPQYINNKNNTRQLFSMYNFYITNKNKSKLNSSLSGYLTDKNQIVNRKFGVLNPKIKYNLSSEKSSSEKKTSILRKKPIKLETIKSNTSFLGTLPLTKNKNIKKDVKSSKIFFNSIISEEIKKNSFKWDKKLSFTNNINNISTKKKININVISNSNLLENTKKQIIINKEKSPVKEKPNTNTNINNLNANEKGRSFSIGPSFSNNSIFQKMKIKPKNIFDMVLKNKCEFTKTRLLNFLDKKSNLENENNDFFLRVNNNIDIKKEDFIKNFFTRHKMQRFNTLGKIK